MQIKAEAYEVHKFALINPTTSVQHFEFCTTSSHFFVADVEVTNTPKIKSSGCLIEVGPQASLQVMTNYVLS